jgi:hypothetical protein
MRVIQRRAVFGLVCVVVGVPVAFAHLEILNLEILFVDLEQLDKVFCVVNFLSWLSD